MLGVMPGLRPDANRRVTREYGLVTLDGPRLTLIIEPGSEPISGRLRLPDETETRFEGYVQLIAALEELRGGPAAAGATPPGAEAARRT
jgi:hypothetical protein